MDAAAVATIAAGYLLGSVDFGVIVPRLLGVDIYAEGSGNPGTTNVLRAMGRSTAAAVMVGDLAKGAVAAMAGDLVGGEVIGFAAGFAAVAGHCFPLWHRFRGGKGVATSAGIALWLEPLAGLGLLVAWALLVGLTRRASIASLVVAAAFVPVLALTDHRGWSLVWGGAVALLIITRHHANIRRLLGGSEPAIEAR
ncbi:MAG TPA: glycerol-3-phosphate 1-O-acyltransferase PlsY [Acidimicrobiia bacterium]